MLLLNMYYKFVTETTDCHSDDLIVGYFSFDSGKQTKESGAGKEVINVFVGKEEDSFLLLVYMVDFGELGREDDFFQGLL